MKDTPLPPTDSPAELRAEREYRAFFRSVVPDPFPPLTLPSAPEPVRSKTRRSLLARGRMVLAICVAAVLISLWAFKPSENDRPNPAAPGGIEANKKDPLGRPIKSTRP